MTALLPTLLLLATADAGTTAPIAILRRGPSIDGKLADTAIGAPAAAAAGATASVKLHAALRGESLILAADIADDVVGPGDALDVALFFQGSGAVAGRGYTFRIAFDGLRALDDELAAPRHAQDQ